MKPLAVILLSVGCATGSAVITSIAIRPPAIVERSSEGLDRELVSLRGEVSRLTEELDSLRRESNEGARIATRLPVGDIGEAVRGYLDEHLDEYVGEGKADVAVKDVREEEPVAAASYLDALLDDTLDWNGREAIWAKIRESGRLDEVVALFEARAEELSGDPDAQVDLGHAYLQKIFELGDSPAAGVVATQADQAYDRALALDEHHWEARYSKSIALSFWPPIFGKQQEAIRNFEILIGQQEEGPAEDRFGESYLLLGNLYNQVGQTEKANEIWSRGLAIFPDSTELRAKFGDDGGI